MHSHLQNTLVNIRRAIDPLVDLTLYFMFEFSRIILITYINGWSLDIYNLFIQITVLNKAE